nr:set domain-containing protein 5 [Quercus suber]
MDTVDSAAGFGYDTNIREDFKRPLFKVHPVRGRGLGLVACLDIAKGSRIVEEAPLLVAKSMSPEALEPILGAKLKSLSKEEQRRYLSLYNNHPGKHPFSGIMRTNALPCGSGSTIGAVYTTICRINHSCVANCHNNWNDARRLETIHAVRNIQAGEEITICYSKGGRSEDRQTELKQAFGFDCTCATCALPAADLAVSDDRCARIQHLDRAIGDPQRMISNPAASLADCYALLQLLQAEYAAAVGANAARLYYDAFQISIAHADQARAAAFAERGYRCRIECEGEDSPETQRTEGFIENPAGHPSFALCSQRWRSQVKSTPRGLDADAFDRWLWGRKERR